MKTDLTQQLAALREQARFVFAAAEPETPTVVNDVIEWFASSLNVLMERQAGEAVAWRYRFHTDDSLSGKPNVRGWVLTDKEPPTRSGDIEVEPLGVLASLPAPQAVQAEPVAWWRVSYVDEEGFSDADVQIGANVPTILPDNGFPWQPLYGSPIPVRPAAPSPDGKAEQAEAPRWPDFGEDREGFPNPARDALLASKPPAGEQKPVDSKRRANAFAMIEAQLMLVQHGGARADLLKALADLYLGPQQPERVAQDKKGGV